MKAGIVPLGQQQQQIQARHLAPLAVARGLEVGRRELVEGQQLLEVAGEGVGVLQADGEEGAGFERGPGEAEQLGGGGRGGQEGVELEELAFGGGEEGGDFLGRGRRCRLEM